MLVVIEGRGLAGGARRNNGVGTVGDMKFDESAQAIGVDSAVRLHRGDQGHHAAVKHDLLPAGGAGCDTRPENG